MKQTKRKLLAGALAAALLLQNAMPNMGVTAVVSAAEPTTKTIVEISALEENEYTLPLEADETAVKELLESFPETITAEVEYSVAEQSLEDSEESSMTEAEAPTTEEASESSTQVEDEMEDSVSLEEETMVQEKEPMRTFAAPLKESSDEKEPVLAEKVVSEQVELTVTWESDKELVTTEAGELTYTATLSDSDKSKYDLAEGVSLPEITVLVGEIPMLMTAGGGTAPSPPWTLARGRLPLLPIVYLARIAQAMR